MGDNVGDTSMVDVDRIEMDLEKTILMIEEQENVIPIYIKVELKSYLRKYPNACKIMTTFHIEITCFQGFNNKF